MKKIVLLLTTLSLFHGVSFGLHNCYNTEELNKYLDQGCIIMENSPIIPQVTGAKGYTKYKVASFSITRIATTYLAIAAVSCPGDIEFDYYNQDKATMNKEMTEILDNNPIEINNYDCKKFSSDFSQERCKETINSKINNKEYKGALEKKEIKDKLTELENTQENRKNTYQLKGELSKENTDFKVMTKEIKKAKEGLGDKAAIFEGLVSIFKGKDETTQTKVKTLLKTFESSKDEYTRNIGIYFGYLVE